MFTLSLCTWSSDIIFTTMVHQNWEEQQEKTNKYGCQQFDTKMHKSTWRQCIYLHTILISWHHISPNMQTSTCLTTLWRSMNINRWPFLRGSRFSLWSHHAILHYQYWGCFLLRSLSFPDLFCLLSYGCLVLCCNLWVPVAKIFEADCMQFSYELTRSIRKAQTFTKATELLTL